MATSSKYLSRSAGVPGQCACQIRIRQQSVLFDEAGAVLNRLNQRGCFRMGFGTGVLEIVFEAMFRDDSSHRGTSSVLRC